VDLRFVELASVARLIVEECMRVEPGEEMLLVTDTRIGEYMGTDAIIMAVMGAVRAAGAEAQLMTYNPRERPNAELPVITAAAMKAADGVFTLPTRPPGHTRAARDAYTGGTRLIMLASGTSYGHGDAAYRLMPRDRNELHRMSELTTRLADVFRQGHHVRFTTAKGTDLTMEIGGRWVYNNNGIAKPGELEVIPAGLAGTGPKHGTASGRLVVDASISPIYEPLTEPMIFEISDGYITSVEGGSQAEEWRQTAEELNDPDVFNIAEIGVGVHPRARVSGHPLEDERIYGSCHIGIGTDISFGGDVHTKWHVDANVLNATLDVDGERIMEDGDFLV
jgi:leucyl aminopeptidase (aminopeptidase T)